jgi:type VI protein secretion system component Hcp
VTAAHEHTPLHFVAAASGKHFDTSAAHFLTQVGGAQKFERFLYEFEDVTSQAVLLETTPTGALTETFSLGYERIKWSARSTPTSPTIKRGWDIPQNKEIDD